MIIRTHFRLIFLFSSYFHISIGEESPMIKFSCFMAGLSFDICLCFLQESKAKADASLVCRDISAFSFWVGYLGATFSIT